MPKRERPGLRSFSVELPEGDLKHLEEIAFADDRSMGSLVRVIISEWLQRNAARYQQANPPASSTPGQEEAVRDHAVPGRIRSGQSPSKEDIRRAAVQSLREKTVRLASLEINNAADLVPAKESNRGRGRKS